VNVVIHRASSRGLRVRVVATALLGGVVLAGCGSSASGAPAPAATPNVDTAAVLAAYGKFFAGQAAISAAPADRRKTLLAPFTTDPELSQLAGSMNEAQAGGMVSYGAPVVHPKVTKGSGDTATVADCQDASGTGLKKASGGKIATSGEAHDSVSTTMIRGADGQWRVSDVEYQTAPC
jgi:hypothetical protein